MSNINPNPKFTPTPGEPVPAKGDFPYPHESIRDADKRAADAMREAVERRP